MDSYKGIISDTLRGDERERPYKLQHPDELFGYTRVMPEDSGLSNAIFIDREGSFIRDGHQPLLFVKNGKNNNPMDFIPFSLSEKASILDNDIELHLTDDEIRAVQVFIRDNLKLLRGFADESISYFDSFDAIKPYQGIFKVIFLDFDGVISVLSNRWELSERHMRRVKKICDETGAKIVISSSWRWESVDTTLLKIYERCRDLMVNCGEDLPVDDSHFLFNKDMIIGVTKRMGPASRGKEIKKWLDEHPEVERYVILDDDSFDMLPEQKPFLIQTDWAGGIEDGDVEKAIDILSK